MNREPWWAKWLLKLGVLALLAWVLNLCLMEHASNYDETEIATLHHFIRWAIVIIAGEGIASEVMSRLGK